MARALQQITPTSNIPSGQIENKVGGGRPLIQTKSTGADNKNTKTPFLETPLGQTMSGIAKGGYEDVKGIMDTGETLMKEKAKQDISQNIPGGVDTLKFIKDKVMESGGQEALNAVSKHLGIDLSKFKIPEKTMAETIQSEVEKKKGIPEGTLLEAKTPIEKTAKNITQIGLALAPVGELSALGKVKEISKTEKALKLSAEELKKIDPARLATLGKKYLKKIGETSGGLLKGEQYNTSDITGKIASKLEKEGLVLDSSKPAKNQKKVFDFMKQNWNKTKELFSGSEKSINKPQLYNRFKKAITEDTSTVYGPELEEVQTKAIKTFQNYFSKVEKGTNLGLEEARNLWYQENAKASGKLSNANQAIHKVIKQVVKETLPEEKKALYDQYKKANAMANDAIEILGSKKEAGLGKSLVGKIKTGLPWLGAYEGLRKITTGRW